MLDEDTQLAVLTAMVPDEIKEKDAEDNSDEDTVELGGFGRVPVPVSSPDSFPKTLTLRTYTLLHH